MEGRLPGWRSVSARPSHGGKLEYRLMTRWAALLVTRAALIAGNESGRHSAAHRADHVTLPSMVQRYQ